MRPCADCLWRGRWLSGLRALLCVAALALAGGAAWASDAAFETIGHGASARTAGEVPSIDEERAVKLANGAVGRRIPNFELRDRYGKPVRLDRYRGKPLLVAFIYTGCFEICPTQTRTLYEAVKGLDNMLGEDHFNIVSIGFNQPFDDPDAMRAFASQHRIRHKNWEFLSPSPQQVEALTEAFGFSWVATPAGFDHVLGVTVVDADGRIHAQVLGDVMTAARLGTPMRRLLLWDQPEPTLTSFDNLVERVRILCTVYDARTGEYRYDYKLIFQFISGVLFFLSMFIFIFRELRQQRRQRRRREARVPCPSSGQAQAASGVGV